MQLFHRIRSHAFLLAVLPLAALAACGDTTTPPTTVDDPSLSGGSMTVNDITSNAFSTPAPNLSGESFNRHAVGDAAFEATFVTRPAMVNGGLGPVYNNTSCVSCHARDGRGKPPMGSERSGSMLVRVSVPGVGEHGGPNPAPGFGGQLQDRGVVGIDAEGSVDVTWSEEPGTYGDGTPYSLRRPTVSIPLSYIPLPSGLMTSARVAPPVFGLGLLEAIPESTLLALADEGDRNGDGITGRLNMVWDSRTSRTTIGRFGWKANTSTLLEQCAAAYNQDMGITSPVFPLESCHGQAQAGTTNDSPDLDEQTLDAVAHYVATLGVPARRAVNDATAKHGEQLFAEAGCGGCHVATLTTGTVALAEVSNQTIHPYTDLLIHDMGDGLSDDRPDYLASGREWRTTPLWGIGLTKVVNGHTFFLHDGRARSIAEAILWHGGEAEAARERFRTMNAADRAALLAFLGSL